MATRQGGLPAGSSDHTGRRSGAFTHTAPRDARFCPWGGVLLSAGSGQAQNAPEEGSGQQARPQRPEGRPGHRGPGVSARQPACIRAPPTMPPPCVEKLGVAAVPSWTLRGRGTQRSDPVPVCLGRPRVSEALAWAEEGCSLGSPHPLFPAPAAGPPLGNAGTGHESDPEDRSRVLVRNLRDPAPTLDGGQSASGSRKWRWTKPASSCL